VPSILSLAVVLAPHARGVQTNLGNRTGRLRVLQGIVLDVQNSPVADTVVRLWNDPERKQMILEGRTDGEGRFRLSDVKRGTYLLSFLHRVFTLM